MELIEKIQLVERRCCNCHRWYATERSSEWVCGSCKHDRNEALEKRLSELLRSNAALRGALRRTRP